MAGEGTGDVGYANFESGNADYVTAYPAGSIADNSALPFAGTMDTIDVNAGRINNDVTDELGTDVFPEFPVDMSGPGFVDIPPPDVTIAQPQSPPSKRGGSGGGGGGKKPGQSNPNSNPNSNPKPNANPLQSLMRRPVTQPIRRTVKNNVVDHNPIYTLSRGENVPGGAGSLASTYSKPGGVVLGMPTSTMLIGGVVLLAVFLIARK